MDWFSFLVAGIMVYLSIAIFLGGTICRIIKWQRHHRNVITQGLPNTKRLMQFFVIALHAIGLGLFLGHTRIFGDVSFALSMFGEDTLNLVGNILGTGLGLFLIIIIGYLLIRRLRSPRKEFAKYTDYFVLLLILLIILLGNYLRLTKPFGLEDYRDYMASLVALNPAFPVTIAASPARWILTGHVLAANLLLAYFPFSNLIPTICSFVNKHLRCGKPDADIL